MHLGVVVGFVALCIAVCAIGRHEHSREHGERRFGRALAWVCLAGWVVQQGYFITVVHNPQDSLPLHVCDLAALIGPLALLIERPAWSWWLRALLFFWGVGLTTQGLVTPTLEHGPNHPRFYLFWLNHGSVVLLAVYDFVVRGYRPRYAEVWFAIGVTYALAALMIPVNLALNANYVFSGPSTPEAPTVLDALGAWPVRLVWMALIVAAVYHALWAAMRILPKASVNPEE